MKLIYGTKEEFGIGIVQYRVCNTKVISILEEFAESGKEVAEVEYDQKNAKSAYASLRKAICRYGERYANLITVARRGDRVFLIRKEL